MKSGMSYPKYLQQLEHAISRFPGVGRRSAERMVKHLLTWKDEYIEELGTLVLGLRENISYCAHCYYIIDAEKHLCGYCEDVQRDRTLLCIVEDYIDVPAIESTGKYHGLYYVLGGALSPLKGISPKELHFETLFERVNKEEFREIIIATNPTMEGESTAMYIKNQLEHYPAIISRIAKGMPMGGDINYADEITLGSALDRRQAL